VLSSLDKSIIRKIQEDLPLVSEPYKEIAQELGIKLKNLVIVVLYEDLGLL